MTIDEPGVEMKDLAISQDCSRFERNCGIIGKSREAFLGKPHLSDKKRELWDRGVVKYNDER